VHLPSKSNLIASTAGLALLLAIDAGAAWFFDSDHFFATAVLGVVFTIPMAVAAWAGVLFSQGCPESWLEWLGMFVVASVFSALFWWIDSSVRNPGPSFALTLAATGLAVIALPSALRAAVLAALNADAARQTPWLPSR
jgi:hypothetical protein